MGMRANQRRAYIEDVVAQTGKITVTEISQACKVTEETVRRDLDKLEEEGKVTRVHGGAIRNMNSQTGGIHFRTRQLKNAAAKKRIADLMMNLLKGKSTIMADSSTTVAETLLALADLSEYTVVTNSVHALRIIENPACTLISTGGIYNESSLSFQGEVATQIIEKFHVDIALISCRGIHMESGVLDSYTGEVDIKRAMIEQAEKVALLVDHTKFSKQAFLKVTELERIDYIVTDTEPDPEWIAFCEQKGITLVYH